MPELPDLTVFAKNLTLKLKGKRVKSIDCYGTKRINVTPEKLQQSISNNTVKEINRSGKEIEFVFSNETKLSIHLMLSGGFSIVKDIQQAKYKILSIVFSEGESLAVSDPKGLVNLNLNPVPAKVPDALNVNADYIKERIFKKPKANVKAFLIDQGIIRGIGNAYADEILWRAKISPKSIVGKLPVEVINDLLKATKAVLLDAIEQIEKIKPGIISGEVRDFLAVHNSRRKQSPTGYQIIKEQIASKTTYYTDEQILYS